MRDTLLKKKGAYYMTSPHEFTKYDCDKLKEGKDLIYELCKDKPVKKEDYIYCSSTCDFEPTEIEDLASFLEVNEK